MERWQMADGRWHRVDDERAVERQKQDQDQDQESNTGQLQKMDARSPRQHLTSKTGRRTSAMAGRKKQKKRKEQEPLPYLFQHPCSHVCDANQLYLDLFSGQSPFVSRLSPLSSW